MDINDTEQLNIYPNGTVIADRFEIESFLAAGGMAQVYVARQVNVDRRVALKILSPMFSMNPGVVMRFFREAKVIAHLSHPNTVHLYDMGETPDKRLFMAIELLDGEELGDRIRRGRIPADEAISIVKQVAGSLSEAHSKGIIHRDLKPDNIYLTKMNIVKVLDFGIAKLKQSDDPDERRLTKVGTAPGTPEYMSPEQARGKELDARSDLYSLGVVLYEMLAGHPPFEEETFLATILMHVQNPPPPLPDDIPLPLRNYVINRMLAKDPICRPDNADCFIQEITELEQKINPSKEQALIDELRSQLAATKLELLRSCEHNIIEEADADRFYAEKAVEQQLAEQQQASNKAASSVLPPAGSARVQSGMNHPAVGQPQPIIIQPNPQMINPQAVNLGMPHQRPMIPQAQMGPQAQMAPQGPMMPPMPGNVDTTPPGQRRAVPQMVSISSTMPQNMTPQAGMQPNPSVQNRMGMNPSMPPHMGASGVMPTLIPTAGPQSGVMNALDQVPPATGPRQMPGMPGRPAQSMPNSMNRHAMQGMPIQPQHPTTPAQMQGFQSNPQMGVQNMPRHAMPGMPAPYPDNYSTPGADNAELIIPPQPRHRAMSPGAQIPSSSDNPRINNAPEVDVNQDSALGRPRDSMTGRPAIRKTQSSKPPTLIFMEFAQPLLKNQKEHIHETLSLAQYIWNAANLGKSALNDLYNDVKDNPSLRRMVDLMLTRKEKFFANEHWQIDNLDVAVNHHGDIKLDFDAIGE